MRKIHTDKYTIYVEGGQIYFKDGRWHRALTEEQYEWVKARKFPNLASKRKLEKLIDTDFKQIDEEGIGGIPLKEVKLKLGFNPQEVPEMEVQSKGMMYDKLERVIADEDDVCPKNSVHHNHKFSYIETRNNKYVFHCQYCLYIRLKHPK